MTKRGSATAVWLTPMALAVVLAAAFVCLTGFSMWMAGSSWNMRGHMGRMSGGGVDTSGAPRTVVAGESASVDIRDFTFTPGNLQVPVGAAVTWTNSDSAAHTATAKTRDWDTGTLNQGESASITFRVAGDYAYYCAIHPSMVAKIVVR